jgi:3-phenylpropionate/trans-cinnamate dioxygenase ferredoxin reductase subunit
VADRSVDVLLVGGGVASASCAGELRAQGFDGSVLLCGRELDPPYERPPISKDYLLGRVTREEALLALPGDVEVLTRTSVMKIDPEARVARLSTKEEVAFDRALLATGANVRRLPLEGADLEGIHYLRALRNADALRADVEGASRVAIVGGSFIACEVAASLTTLGIAVTMLLMEGSPLELQFGARVGGWVRGVLEAHGVEVLTGEQVVRLSGEGETVSSVETRSGRIVECDAVLIGAGAVPDVMLARSSGFALGERGGVASSAALETSVEHVWAAGDICEYDSVLHGGPVRIEHHEVAAGQGRCAARNMLGGSEAYADVPYFWSDLADWFTLEAVGPAVRGWDAEELRGSFDDGAFSVWYSLEGRLVACLSCGRPEDLDEARAALRAAAAL